MKFLGRFQGVCVAGVGRGRQVEAVKYKKGQANYREANLTRSPKGNDGTPPVSLSISRPLHHLHSLSKLPYGNWGDAS